MFFIVTIVTIHQVATCWKEHNSFLNIIIPVLPLTIMLYVTFGKTYTNDISLSLEN